MDTGASSHLADNTSILTSCSNSSIYPSVFVGNGHSIPVTHTGHSFLHTSSKPLHLNHILVTPHIIKNLILVRQFTSDNDVSIEFDAYGFSFHYMAQTPRSSRRRCKLVKLPFYNSESSVDSVFKIIHSDIWTSPIPSESGIKYYAIFLDHFSHFVWVYPLHKKSDLFDNFVAFHAYVNKQFNVDIKALQCDHGGESAKMAYNFGFLALVLRNRMANPSKEAMLDKNNALITNRTWVLVSRPANVNVVRSMWLFKHKFNVDGSLSRYKARLVANGRNQQQGIDCDESFSLVVKPATIRTVLSLAISRDWPIYQLDVKNAFLHGHLSEIAYLHLLESKLGSDGDPINDPTLYRSLADALQYLTFMCPDLSYVLHVSSTTQLTAYTDVDWAGCPVTRRSTSGYCVFLGDNLLSWSAKRQVTLSRSSAEAEFRGVANIVVETAWIYNLLRELHTPLFTAIIVYCDNVSAVYMPANPVQHQRTKRIEIDIHVVRDFVASGQVRVLHVPSRFQYADIFTSGLPTALFIEFRSSLNVRRPPAHIEGSISRV
ncbi:ribonuclease H-like domain-containing protein [Tanacetum coccineum]